MFKLFVKTLQSRVRFVTEAICLTFASTANFRAVVTGYLGGSVKPFGRVHVFLRDALTGQVKENCWHPNLLVSAGKYHIADQLSDAGEAAMSHMAIGTGTTAAAAADTALQTELDRNALTSKTQGAGADANKVTYVGDWAAGDGTGAITEAGIFNGAAAGTMLCRSVFSVKNKGAGDALTLTWVLTIS